MHICECLFWIYLQVTKVEGQVFINVIFLVKDNGVLNQTSFRNVCSNIRWVKVAGYDYCYNMFVCSEQSDINENIFCSRGQL